MKLIIERGATKKSKITYTRNWNGMKLNSAANEQGTSLAFIRV